jgi:uncharacterized membrane protein
MLPIAMGLGEGSEWRSPMAVTVIGGLLTSTLLTLVLIPAVYTILDDFTGALSRVPQLFRRMLRRPVKAHVEQPTPEQPERPPRQVPVPVGGGSE